MQQKYLADFSLALINRTGAYFICRDIVESLSNYFYQVRYWRFNFDRPPEGLFRKILARFMLKDISWFTLAKAFYWPAVYRNGQRLPTVFFDPLYVLRADLRPDDIVLCHDVGPISHAHLFDEATTRNYKTAYAKIASVKPGMIFVSNASKFEFEKLYGYDFRYLRAIPLYARPAIWNGDLVPVKGVWPSFLLTVGALEKRKNYLRVIEAYASTKLHEEGVAYVLCGARGNAADEIRALAAATPGVTALAYVSDAQLRWLYANASGFVLPSLLEGFGLPALEAVQAGLVPLVSQGGAQEEAIGGNGILVDPASTASIANGLQALAHMTESGRASMIARARAHADTLTFDRFLHAWEEALLCNDGFV
jgi:glycosyltransferase involved in cell wall biosynthesis